MTDPYDLAKLGPNEFANIVNCLALEVLGRGNTGFSPGPDGGRDGYFQGEAPYPSVSDRWKGSWYIQSKFHAPHLSTDSQKWLRKQVAKEIKAFDSEESDRTWPDNWVIATNIDPSGKPETGSFDAIKRQLKNSRGGKRTNLAIWGGRKIIDLLILHTNIANVYRHFLTPGHVIARLYEELNDKQANIKEIVRYFIATQFSDHQHTKLDQAGSTADMRPGVHQVFIDLPFRVANLQRGTAVLAALARAAAQCHRYSVRREYPESWATWSKQPERARVSLIKGGPGQGKSTVAQYLCQIHRAYFILSSDGPTVNDHVKGVATAVREAAEASNLWPISGRIPVQIELKEFVHWYSTRTDNQSTTVLVYIAETVARKIGSEVHAKTLKRALSHRAWVMVFDGLDEVPNDYKDSVANEVVSFLNDLLIDVDADVLAVCTSRPQGYSGQFAGLEGPVIELLQLDAATALRCAQPVLGIGRSAEEAKAAYAILEAAVGSPNVKELMTTPLQSHIMAVVVRDGGRPPEKRWNLFDSFYHVMKKRESLKNFQNARIAKLLREEDRLLKSVHSRLGFVLHARAERSEGAQTMLSREEFRHLVRDVVAQLGDDEIEDTVSGVMEATTERLVLVSTPESGETVRFDIRQLQEFFAAEFLYAAVDVNELESRIATIGGDAHWREVLHFVISALIENERSPELAVSVQVLRVLNEGGGEVNSLFFRRMARAGLIGSRLLVEGVIEQDQRDRHQLRPLFDPLSGLIDIDKLLPLTKMGPEKSKQWLMRFFVDQIGLASPKENAGALFVLGWILPRKSPATQTTRIAFLNLPTHLQEEVIDLWDPGDRWGFFSRRQSADIPERLLSEWVVDICVHFLNGEIWTKYRPETIRSLLRISLGQQDEFKRACAATGIREELADALYKIIEMQGVREIRGTPESNLSFDCGLLRAHRYSADWINGNIPSQLATFVARPYVAQTGGFFHFLLTCAWWAQEKSEDALSSFLTQAEAAGPLKVGATPPALLALVPIPGPQALEPNTVIHIRCRSEADIERWIASLADSDIAIPCAEMFVLSAEQRSEKHWELVTKRLPRLAVSAALNPTRLSWAGAPIFVPALRSLIEANPRVAAESILGWGTLISHQPDLLALLKVRVAALSPCPWNFPFRGSLIVEPFMLEIPNDLGLLPVLAPALVEVLTAPTRHGHIVPVGDEPSLSVSSTLASYGLDAQCLREIAVSNNIANPIRAGALALFWLAANDVDDTGATSRQKLDLINEKVLYVEVVTSLNEGWLARALIAGVLEDCSETDPHAVAFVTYLMERCLEGEGPREAITELIERWRERSSAPVYAKQALERWLGYQFEIPDYARS